MMTKYYTYLSDSKVDMILSQIDKNYLSGIALELGIDWKILSLKLSKEFDTQKNRIKRLEAVASYIISKKEPKTVDDNTRWIKGVLQMTSFELTENNSAIFFLGETEETLLLLGGSAFNLLGGEKKEHIEGGLSHTHRLIKSLNDNIEHMNIGDKELNLFSNSIGDGDQIKPWKTQIKLLKQRNKFQFEQNMEFLARVLI